MGNDSAQSNDAAIFGRRLEALTESTLRQLEKAREALLCGRPHDALVIVNRLIVSAELARELDRVPRG